MRSRSVVASLFVFLSGCAYSEKELVKIRATNHAALDSAAQSSDPEKLTALCRTPLVARGKFRKPWNDTETSAEACQLLKERFENANAAAIAEAKKDGGVECLARLRSRFELGRNMKPESFAWQKEDALRAALGPTAEACTTEVESFHADGTWRLVYSVLLGHEPLIESPAFEASVQARLKTLWAGAPKGALDEFEAAARSSTAPPLAQSLFRAAAACAAQSIGNKGRTTMQVQKARELVLGAEADKVKVTVKGPAALADAVQKVGAGASVVFAENGELAFELSPGAPSFKAGKETLSRTAERTVPGGTRTNPEYSHVQEDCERIERMLDREQESCQRNGSRNANCGRIAGRQKEVASCRKKLSGIKQQVPATRTESMSYEVTRVFGEVSGVVGLKNLKDAQSAARQLQVTATVDHFEHGSVPGFNVNATSRATPVAESELRGAFEQTMASVVAGAIREQATELFSQLLLTAVKSPSNEERAAAYLRYTIVTNKSLDDRSHAQLTRALALPTREAMNMLTGK
jgi:hypothetical protein